MSQKDAAVAERNRGWTESDLSQDLSFLLARSNALSLATGTEALRPFGLKVRSYPVLSLACEAIRPSQREIADFLRLDPSQVVALVDDLELRELVERRTDTRDRRSKVVVATAQGRRVYAEAREAMAAAEEAPFSVLTDAEQEQLAGFLRRLAFPAGEAS
ncbi:MarR family winged helix-turn-helix transcriptional regulator [Leucobacter rhizosphaerae]|uniref:MarR family winged helix-turn-helix transcriptional regulator n=1 Tax=Leucobacter rhizosphaerae TaxID=2932245 RepID=A0ABY4FRZ4_9MICO|nr:MarR family winged helix-turn-helix transcriptional regulator [Leucobacter rhizosphaerae]UOQ59059.1 MarR family winged helix-turn-helix transcriptional regulator [Leucobacter rhizosphaerae]